MLVAEPPVQTKKTPRAIQNVVVDRAIDHFHDHDRAILNMFPGTGKTAACVYYLSLRDDDLQLYFAPSILLTKQAKGEYNDFTLKEGVKILVVCSEKERQRPSPLEIADELTAIEADEFEELEEQAKAVHADFEVTTSVDRIASFMEEKVRNLFSPLIIQAKS